MLIIKNIKIYFFYKLAESIFIYLILNNKQNKIILKNKILIYFYFMD